MEIGDNIEKYCLLSRLGRGGMGEVWLAKASGYGGFTKTVVLKTLRPELAGDPLFIEMLAHEARICARLSHPNLIEVFDFSEHDGIYLLAMEHVVGRPLHHIMKAAHAREWDIPAWFALRVAWECCRGLECAHEQGVIHCDLSPSNVMVSFTGVTKILDFGVAHSNARGAKPDRLKGKFAYMAPERIKSLSTDRRTDIYSLGVMLYLLFTGQLPFAANTDRELLSKIVNERPRPPSAICPIDPSIERIILRAMDPDPSARHQTVRDMIDELSPCLDGQLGAYGQHDAAAFVSSLFDSSEIPRHLRLTASARHRVRDDDDVTLPTGVSKVREVVSVELASVDVEIESSDLEVWREAPASPHPSDAFVSRARASSSLKPLAKPLLAVFARPSSEPREPGTSVQSLFEERPSLAFGHSKVFERPPLDLREPHAPEALRTEHRWFESASAGAVAEPEPSARESARGVFGGYSASASASSSSSSRPAAAVHWPWPRSRSK